MRKRKGIAGITRKILLLSAVAVICISAQAKAEETATIKLSDALSNLQLGILGYVDYSAGHSPLAADKYANFNRFTITRGYFTVIKGVTPWLNIRLTTDVYQDTTTSSGNSTNGKYLLRLKFLYGEFLFPNLGPITNSKLEAGMIRTPWFDFEEGMNIYRAQGTMAFERAGISGTTDIGVDIAGYIGGKLENAKERTGSEKYSGKYGSWFLGVYNGGGYMAIENNQNKVVAGRLSLRPLPGFLPGLQLSYFGQFGQGNAQIAHPGFENDGTWPYFDSNMGMLSFEHSRFAVTGQYFVSRGNSAGTWLDSRMDALATEGYSFFANVKLPVFKNRLALFGRYDKFNPDVRVRVANNAGYELWFAGASFDIYKGNMIIIDYQNTAYEENSGGLGKAPKIGNNLGRDDFIQTVLVLKF